MNVQAHDANGQVWISWPFRVADAAQVYEVYMSNAAFANINQGTLVARLFPEDYCGRRLVGDLGLLFGAGGRTNFTIPNGAGGTVPLPQDRGLCVQTVRPGGLPARFYAVVPRGVTAIPAGSLSAMVPPAAYSLLPANSPICHLQQAGIVNVVVQGL